MPIIKAKSVGRSHNPIGTITRVYAPDQNSPVPIPPGWLPLNGGTYNCKDYPDLLVVTGTTYASADGKTFTLPDMRGRHISNALLPLSQYEEGYADGYEGRLPPLGNPEYMMGYEDGQGSRKLADETRSEWKGETLARTFEEVKNDWLRKTLSDPSF